MATQKYIMYDQEQFDSLFRSMQKSLFYSAIRIVKDARLAADIVQDVFLKAIENEVFNGRVENIPAYLTGMVRNEAIDAVKQNSTTVVDTDEVSKQRNEDADDSLAGFDVISEDEMLEEVMEMIENELTKSEFEVFKLKRQGLSRSDMAEVLGNSEATVHSHVTSINRKLRGIREMLLVA